MQNIRDSNWIKFSSDYKNCWNVLNYNQWCVGWWVWYASTLIPAWSYIAIQTNWTWTLTWKTAIADPNDIWWFKNTFPVYLDDLWSNTQSWSYTKHCNSTTVSTWCITDFWREIRISYPDWWVTTKRMKVESIVKWVERSKNAPYSINLSTILTNWKEDLQ